MLSDFFDTVGTVVAVGQEAKYLDAEGNYPRPGTVLMIDSLAAAAGGAAGASSATTYIESAAGAAAGGRTGLASVVTALLFAACERNAIDVEVVAALGAVGQPLAIGGEAVEVTGNVVGHLPGLSPRGRHDVDVARRNGEPPTIRRDAVIVVDAAHGSGFDLIQLGAVKREAPQFPGRVHEQVLAVRRPVWSLEKALGRVHHFLRAVSHVVNRDQAFHRRAVGHLRAFAAALRDSRRNRHRRRDFKSNV